MVALGNWYGAFERTVEAAPGAVELAPYTWGSGMARDDEPLLENVPDEIVARSPRRPF
jgi:hypothetical protein